MKQRREWGVSPVLYLLAAVFSVLCINSATIYAQGPVGKTEPAAYTKKEIPLQTSRPAPYLKEYRKVTIGMPADALRDAWGKPEMEYPDGYFYELSDSETVQIVIGPDKKITAISVTFVKGKGAPSFAEVFGEKSAPEKSANGSVYKMVRYEDAGYWVAYSGGPEDDANVSVTMQKF